MPLLHCGWHVTSRTRQQTADRSGSEIQLSKRGGGWGLTRCLLAWILVDAYPMRHAHTRGKQSQIQMQTHTLTQRLGGIIPALPAHCGDLSLNQTRCPHREQVSDQVSAVRWWLAASSQLTSHRNLAIRRGHENSQLNGISQAYVIKVDSIMSPVNPGLANVYQRLKTGALLLNSDYSLQRKFRGCFLFPERVAVVNMLCHSGPTVQQHL